jgi:uncharacterized protein YndB with AHSA1/START domain
VSVTITRVYHAPREAVWRAWTEPAQIAAWWGKRGWRTPPESVTLELRPGGAFRLASINEADGREMRHDAVFREVVAPERLVFSDGASVATLTLADLGNGRTEMTFHTTAPVGETAVGGMNSAFDRLGEQVGHSHEQGAIA